MDFSVYEEDLKALKSSGFNSDRVEIGKIFYYVQTKIEGRDRIDFTLVKNREKGFGKTSEFKKWYTSNGYTSSYVSDYKKAYYLFSILKDEENLQEHSHNLSFQKIRLLTKSEHIDSLDLIIKILKIDMENNSIPYKKMKEYLDGRVVEFDKVFNLFSEIKIQLKHYSKEDKNDLAESLDDIKEQLKRVVLNEKIRAKMERKIRREEKAKLKTAKLKGLKEEAQTTVEDLKENPVEVEDHNINPIKVEKVTSPSNNNSTEVEKTIKNNITNSKHTPINPDKLGISRFKDRSSNKVKNNETPKDKDEENVNQLNKSHGDKNHSKTISEKSDKMDSSVLKQSRSMDIINSMKEKINDFKKNPVEVEHNFFTEIIDYNNKDDDDK